MSTIKNSMAQTTGLAQRSVLNKRWRRVFLVLTALFLLTVFILLVLQSLERFRRPAFTPVEAPKLEVSTGQPRLTNIQFTGVPPILPAQFESYVSGGEYLSLDDLTKRLAENLGLSYQADGDFWENIQSGETLYATKTTGRIKYSQERRGSLLGNSSVRQEEVVKKVLPPDGELVDTALSFINRLNYAVLPSAQSATLEYLAGELDLREVPRDEAKYVKVSFRLSLDTYPLFIDSGDKNPFIVMVSSEKKVTSADLGLLIPTPIKEGVLQPKPIETAVEELRQNRGIMVRAEVVDLTTGIFEIRRLRSVNFDRVNLEYRYVSESGRFYPFYHFYGDAQTATGERGKLEMIVPAYLPVAGL